MPRKPVSATKTTKKDSGDVSTQKTKVSVDLNKILYMNKEFKCKNKRQKDLIILINEKEIVLATGPAGVGKSYVAIARALELLKSNSTPYSKIVIATPLVEAEEKLGFLPGDVREKMEPFVASSMDIIDKLIGKSNRNRLEELGVLEVQALAYIRGKSIDNTILIMEEAQNMSPNQMKTLLTRIGNNSKFIISGDLDQSDRYRNFTDSGLYDAINKHKNVSEIGFIEFGNEDIVRNPIISKILANYKPKTIDVKKPIPPKTQVIREGGKSVNWFKSIFSKIYKFFI